MNLILLYNPISGQGRGKADAEALAQRLEQEGHAVSLAPTQIEPRRQWLKPLFASTPADALVVAGGDGAVRMVASSAANFGIPLIQYPSGTENLFAREFDMRADPESLLATLADPVIHDVDLGVVETGGIRGVPFVLMASIGYDAEVVHHLASSRTGGISHLTYVRPMLSRLIDWKPPRLTITVDGTCVVTDEPGLAIVANSRQYGGRLDPAWCASMKDGQLDLVFIPLRTRRDLIRRFVTFGMRRHRHDAAIRYLHGRSIHLAAAEPFVFQVDGDPPKAERIPDDLRKIHILLQDKKLRVMASARAHVG